MSNKHAMFVHVFSNVKQHISKKKFNEMLFFASRVGRKPENKTLLG